MNQQQEILLGQIYNSLYLKGMHWAIFGLIIMQLSR